MHFMSKKSEEVLNDILYEMKDLGIDVNDAWISSRLNYLLNDMWESGRKDGHDEGYREGYDKAMGRFENPEL